MKVLLIAAASSVHTMRWANAFVQRGAIVHLVSEHDPIPGFDQAVRLHRLPHVGGLGYLLNRTALRRIVREFHPDVMNAHYASGYGTLAVRDSNVPLVLNVWGSDVYEFPDAGPVQRWLLRRNLRRADAVVSTSEVMARRTSEVCPGLGPITVVPFGVDVECFSPIRHAESDELVIGTVKTLAPKYGVDTLLRALNLLRDQQPKRKLRSRIVGGGSQEGELKQLAKQLALNEATEFVGSVPHDAVPGELRKLDVYVALSRTHSESFGVAIIEASACGLPVVVSNVGGLPEVVEDGVTGFIVPPEDPLAAANALEQLLASKELRDRMGAAGRRRVERLYAWEACVDRQIAVLRSAIEKKRS